MRTSGLAEGGVPEIPQSKLRAAETVSRPACAMIGGSGSAEIEFSENSVELIDDDGRGVVDSRVVVNVVVVVDGTRCCVNAVV